MPLSGLWRRLTRGVERCFHRADWPAFAGDDAEQLMRQQVTDRFHAKQGRSTGRWVATNDHGTLSVFLKRHYELPWRQRLLATLWPWAGCSPGLSEWRHLRWAERHAIPVPEPVAAGEFIGPWFRLRSYLAVEELSGMIPLSQAVPIAQQRMNVESFRLWKLAAVRELARITHQLHGNRHFHKDLYLSHFFIARNDADPPAAQTSVSGRIFLIDFHRLAHHSLTWRRWQIKDLAQLLYSSFIPGIDDRDRLRFFHFYNKQGKAHSGRRLLLRIVWRKANRYLRHNTKRQEAKRKAA